MRRVLFVVSLLSVLGAIRSPAVAGQNLTLGIGARDALYYPGDRLELAVSAVNTGGTAESADFYAGLILPDGVTVATLGPGGSVTLGPLGAPAAFLPLARGIALQGAFTATIDPLFTYAWSGAEPLGAYTVFIAAVRAGGFDDNRIDGGDVLAVRFGGLALRRPATMGTPDVSATARITAATGGNVTATAANGIRYQLSIPGGALADDTDITVTALGGASGLPLASPIATVRFGPDGLQLNRLATLTLTLPVAPRRKGVVGFTVNDDGTRFRLQPAVVSGATITVPIAHFSSGGAGFFDCRGQVTTAVGLAACAHMQNNLDQAVQIIDGDPNNFPIPLRNLLASEIANELRIWINAIVIPALDEAAGPNDASTVQYFFDNALREWSTINAIADLAEGLNTGTVLAKEFAEVTKRLPDAFAGRRRVANATCDAKRANASAAIKTLLDLSFEAQRLGLGPAVSTQGITCLVLSVTGSVDSQPVARSGTTLHATAEVRHSDGGPIVDPALRYPVKLLASPLARASLGSGTSTQSPPGQPAELSVSASPQSGPGSNLVVDLAATAEALGLATSSTISVPIAQGFAISPDGVTLKPGDTQAYVMTEDGDPTQFPVTWTSTAGSISSSGVLTAGSTQGRFSVTGAATTANNVIVVRSALLTVGRLTVSPKSTTMKSGQSRQFTATRNGQPVSASWSASDGTFSPTQGSTVTFTAGNGGSTVTVQADDGQGNQGFAGVTVQGVVVSPSQIVLAPHQTQQFTVVVEGASNQAVTWALSGTAAGSTISPTGLFTAGGSATTVFVTATSVADPSSVGIAQVTVQGTQVTVGTLRLSGTDVAGCSPKSDAVRLPLPLHGLVTCSDGNSIDGTMQASGNTVSWTASATTAPVPRFAPVNTMLLTSNFDIPAAPRAGVVTLEINPGWADTTFTITLDLTGDKSGRARVSRNVDGSVGTMNPVVSIPVVAGDELSVSIIVDCATGCVGSGALATVTVP